MISAPIVTPDPAPGEAISDIEKKVETSVQTPPNRIFLRPNIIKNKPELTLLDWLSRDIPLDGKFGELVESETMLFDELNNVSCSGLLIPISKMIYDIEKEGHKIIPDFKDIFNSMRLCPAEHTKLIILGESPYPQKSDLEDRNWIATGLSFSTDRYEEIPLSAQKLLYLIKNDKAFNPRYNSDFTFWALEGVLMLNVYMTMTFSSKKEVKMSFHKQWIPFVVKIIETVLSINPSVPIIAYGKESQTLLKSFPKAKVFSHMHPSAAAYAFQNNKGVKSSYSYRFSEANADKDSFIRDNNTIRDACNIIKQGGEKPPIFHIEKK